MTRYHVFPPDTAAPIPSLRKPPKAPHWTPRGWVTVRDLREGDMPAVRTIGDATGYAVCFWAMPGWAVDVWKMMVEAMGDN